MDRKVLSRGEACDQDKGQEGKRIPSVRRLKKVERLSIRIGSGRKIPSVPERFQCCKWIWSQEVMNLDTIIQTVGARRKYVRTS